MKKMLVIVFAMIFSFTFLGVFEASAGRPIQKKQQKIQKLPKTAPTKTAPQKTSTKLSDTMRKTAQDAKAQFKER